MFYCHRRCLHCGFTASVIIDFFFHHSTHPTCPSWRFDLGRVMWRKNSTLSIVFILRNPRLSAGHCFMAFTRRSGCDLGHIHLVDDWASTGVEIAQSRLGPVRFLSLNTGILNRNSGPENGTINRPIFRPQNHDERSVTTPSVTLRWSINRYRQAVR